MYFEELVWVRIFKMDSHVSYHDFETTNERWAGRHWVSARIFFYFL